MERRNSTARLILSVLLLGLFALNADAQKSDSEAVDLDANQIESREKVLIPFNWKVGNRRKYSVEKTEYARSEPVVKRSTIEIEVLSVTEEHIVARILYSIVISPEQAASLDQFTRAIVKSYDRLPIEVTISKSGELINVQSKELEEQLEKTRKLLTQLINEMNLGEREREIALNVANSTSIEQVQQSILSPFDLLLRFTNVEISIDETDRFESTATLAVLGEVPSNDSLQVLSIDENAVAIRYTQTIEGERATKLIQERLMEYSKRIAPEETPQPITIDGKFSYSTGDLHIEMDSGWTSTLAWRSKMMNLETGKLELKHGLKIELIESSKSP